MGERRRHGWSARTRIVAWLVVLVGLVLAANLLIATRVLRARADERLSAELVHEYEKLAAFVGRLDGSADRVDTVLTDYLDSALPDRGETYFTVVDGRPDRRSANDPARRLDRDPEFVALVAAATAPEVGRRSIDGVAMRYGVFPVAVPGDERDAALVVVEFVDPAATRTPITTLALVGLGALILAGLVSWFVAGRLLRPIQAVSDTAERISESDLTRRIDVRGNDDVAELAGAFNRMLDRLEAAFDGQRQFLDDAGHELRTPLTVVRGQLEVLGEDPAERARVMPLVFGELDRMSRIVDDLLVLARAERPDFLAPRPVDLADLTVEVLAKAGALAERRWTVSEVAMVTAMVDGQRITQALMQLVANAVEHTGPADQIDVGSAWRDQRVELWVRDTGSGIAPADQERVFDRFVSDGDSTGLGLAIVRSIAEAHRGQVSLASAPGSGSTFTIVLPGSCVVASAAEGDDDLDQPDAVPDGPDAVPDVPDHSDTPSVVPDGAAGRGGAGTGAAGEVGQWRAS